MREHVVHAAGMDVESLAQIFHAHGAAFQVPAGTSVAPWARPFHIAVGLAPRFPQSEVRHGIFFVFVAVDPDARALLFAVDPRQLAIFRKLVDRKIHRSVFRLVGDAFFEEDVDHALHFRDVGGGFRIMFRRFDPQGFQILEERVLVFPREILQLQARRFGIPDRLVVHVRQVHHLCHLIAEVFQRPAQQIFEQIGAEVADMSVIIDRRAAGVHPHLARLDRGEFLQGPPQRIEKPHFRLLDSVSAAPSPPVYSQ